jgi:hypothetical protein
MHNVLLRYRQLISLTADKSPVGYFNRANCLIFSSLDGDTPSANIEVRTISG